MGLDDWVHFPDIVFTIAPETVRYREHESEEPVLRAIAEMLTEDLVTIGDVTSDAGFTAWSLSPSEALDLIRTRWRNLGRPLEMGDICWLKNTEEGNRRGVIALATE